MGLSTSFFTTVNSPTAGPGREKATIACDKVPSSHGTCGREAVSVGKGTPKLLIPWKSLGTVEQKSWSHWQEKKGKITPENSYILLKSVVVQNFERLQGYFVLPVLSHYPSCLQKEVSDFLPFWSQCLIISDLLSVGGQGLAQNLVLQTQVFLLCDWGPTCQMTAVLHTCSKRHVILMERLTTG